jgi:hypothetical protein
MVQHRENRVCIAANLSIEEATEILWNLSIREGWDFEIVRQYSGRV